MRRTTADVPPLCSSCFQDEGLRLAAHQVGIPDAAPCSNCRSTAGRKLDTRKLEYLAHRFFVWGTLDRQPYGAAPFVQFNEHRSTEIHVPSWLAPDMKLISTSLGIGFFYYGPRLWMVGEVEPLKQLQRPESRDSVVARIITAYPGTTLEPEHLLYRLRQDPEKPADPKEYDSPPADKLHSNRLDSQDLPVLYASSDLQTCVQECRVTAEDDLFFATLAPVKPLRLLDLTPVLAEEGVTEFESLDMTIHMLFLAAAHSYDISRSIATAAQAVGYDGIMYPSYFSLLQTGAMPFETVFGLSLRQFPQLVKREEAKIVPNVGLFGRPIQDGTVAVKCINRLILHRVQYGFHYGPVIE